MNIAIVGMGYVGLVTGTGFAETGNIVWCVDNNDVKINRLNAGKIPIYEPGLQELVIKNIQAGRLNFTSDLQQALKHSSIVFITVGTPPGPGGNVDLTQVYNVAREIGRFMEHYTVVVNKSTVPVGTAQAVRKIIAGELAIRGAERLKFDIVSNPEFLKEGCAVVDFMQPDRVIIGTDSSEVADLMKQLYRPFIRDDRPLLIMDPKSAEISKYAANAMLATRISFINEIAHLCDKVGADIECVRLGMGADDRIGMRFLSAGAGYGGSCFPKDVKELICAGQRNGLKMEIITAVDKVNECQKQYLCDMIHKYFGGNLSRKKIAVWGLAFKPETDDMREAPAAVIIRSLVEMGAVIKAYDPKAINNAQEILEDCTENIGYAEDMMEALDEADALVLITEWQQFSQPDFAEMKNRMRQWLIFDGRNQYDPKLMAQLGFKYYCIGRGHNA